ncbi:MAG TPA: site-specific integrase [Rhizomicrobium sp.]
MVEIKGIHKVKANGVTYYYAWRGGPRLEGAPGSKEFLDSYAEAKSPISNLDRKRVSTWIALYKDSDSFKDNAESTRRIWDMWLDRIDAKFGKLSIRQFDRPKFRVDIRKWRDGWKDNPRTADYAKQVLSAFLSFVVAEGELTLNICHEIPNIYSADRSDIIWEDCHIKQLLECEEVSKEVKWAARLAKLTGFRKSDLLKVSWNHVGKYAIEIRTQKSSGKKSKKKRTAVAPITKELRDLLAEIPKYSTTILTSSRKRPWTADGFGSSWWKALDDAGFHKDGPDLHLHDFRGTFATILYVARFSIREIADTLGWTEERVERLIDRYVKRDAILQDRIRRLEAVAK